MRRLQLVELCDSVVRLVMAVCVERLGEAKEIGRLLSQSLEESSHGSSSITGVDERNARECQVTALQALPRPPLTTRPSQLSQRLKIAVLRWRAPLTLIHGCLT